jgi:hypothetical protein
MRSPSASRIADRPGESSLSRADARHCLRKQLTLHHALELEAEAQVREGKERVVVPLPWLWMLIWSHPRVLRNAWGMTAIEGWPRGFYAAPEGLSVGLVVLPELPRERSTLPLRMFGDEEVRRGLRQEYEALAEDDPMRQALGRMLTYWQLWVLGQPQDERVTRWFMDFHQVVQQQLQKPKDEGEARGKAEGLRAAVADLCEVLGIGVTEARKAHLAGLDVAGLEALRQHLKLHRSWPA